VRRAMDAAAMRLLGVIVTGCAAAGALAAPAGAATVAHDPLAGGGATYTAAAGEANRLTVRGDGVSAVFADVVGIAAPQPPPPPLPELPGVNDCLSAGTTASCPTLAPALVSLGDGNDVVAIDPTGPPVAINGGDGNDTLVDPAPSAGTAFDGGTGTDRTDFSARAGAISVSMDNGIADDGAPGEGDNVGGEDLAGGAGDDHIAGTAAANGISGGGGSDVIAGAGDNDGLDGDTGNDTLSGEGGNDTLLGGDGADALIGADGADLLVGGPGPDALDGGPGNDTINAADGVSETVACGTGVDTLVADLGAGNATDTTTGCENVTGPVAPPRSAPPAGPRPALGLPGLVTVLAPGVASPTDLTPPRAALRSAIRQKLRTVSARGVEMRITCAEPCGLSAALSIARPAARRLGLAGRTGGAVLGTAIARRATPGVVRLRVKLSRRARQAVRRTRSLAVTVQVLVSDASGNGTLLQRRVTLVR
jgi:hypothetical protein